MKFPCPYCRKELDFMEMSHESDLRAIIKMQPAFGKHAHLVWAYLELFGITPMRAKAKKIRILLEAIKRLFDAESFTYQKRAYKISQAGIAEALNVVVHRNFADGLDSHNYLKKVMLTIAEKEERESGKQAERDLRKKEAGLMSGGRYPEAEEEARVEENRRRMKDLLKKMGG